MLEHLGEFVCEVAGFERVALIVVEFVFGLAFRAADGFPFHHAVTPGTDGAAEVFPFRIGVESVVANAGGGIAKHRDEADAVDGLRSGRRGEPGDFC